MKKPAFFLAAFLLISNAISIAQVDTAWLRIYNGPTDGNDWPAKLVIDEANNIYTTGYSVNPTNYHSNIVTIKYFPDGDTAWIRNFYSPGQYAQANPTSFAIDRNGNIYVAGFCGSYSGGLYNYVLIKYLANGDLAWTRLYDPEHNWNTGPSIALDRFDNIYLTGYTIISGSNDLLLIKYGSDGSTDWVRSYNGPANGDECGMGIAFDDSDNIYVTGFIFDTLSRRPDVLTLKFNSSGSRIWEARFNGESDSWDSGYDIATDQAGDIYIGGSTGHLNTGSDLLLIKYNPNGDTIWTRWYDGSAHMGDSFSDMKIDYAGNIVLCGSMQPADTLHRQNFITLKYSPDGNELWQRLFIDPGNSSIGPTDMCLDSLGNIYLTGHLGQNLVAIKYLPSGDSSWVWRYCANQSQMGRAIALDMQSNILIAADMASRGVSDISLIKLLQNQVEIKNKNTLPPGSFHLSANYPNPFNPSTTIEFTLMKRGHTLLVIFDLLGRQIRKCVDRELETGRYSILWDGKDDIGEDVPSGTYFYKLTSGDFTRTMKMVLVR